MPERGISGPFEEKIKKQLQEKGPFWNWKYSGVDKKILGGGSECVVIPLEGSENKVAAITLKDLSSYEAKKMFYNQRILSTLFPYNFPKIYASFAKHPDPKIQNISGTIRQRIEGPTRWQLEKKLEHEGTLLKLLRIVTEKDKIKYPFEEAEDGLNQAGLPVGYDTMEDNFMVGADGGEYYVDTPNVYIEITDVDKLMAYMQKNKYTAEDIETVRKSIERLRELGKIEEEKNHKQK
ncbi:MAG: hypothetical protein Q8R36_04240 [bacterium]|nr:hypothetical protein [bacterium]